MSIHGGEPMFAWLEYRQRSWVLWCVALLAGSGQCVYSQAADMQTQPTYERACPKAVTPGKISCHALRRNTAREPNAAIPAYPSTASVAGFGPADLQSAYQYDSGLGVGKTVAIVVGADDPNAEADLAVYRSNYGLPPCTTANGCFRKINADGQTTPLPAPDEGWSEEVSLNLDVVSAVCPKCNLLLVEADIVSGGNSEIGQAVNQAALQGAAAISNSYGGDEDITSVTTCAAYYNHPGIAVVVSAGDVGYAVKSPANCPNVTSVGGTSLVRDTSSRGWTETVWNNEAGAPGSGCSQFIAKPGYQSDTGCTMRMVADIAAVADPDTGVAVYDSYQSSGWGVYGGTSVGSALVSGMYALAKAPGAKQLPALFAYENSQSLNDVTTGNNIVPGGLSCAGNTDYFCHAEVGYDGPTGNGTPNGLGAFEGNSNLSSSGPTTFHEAAHFTFRINATKGGPIPKGTVNLIANSQSLGTCTLEQVSVHTADCKITNSSLAAGGNLVTGTYSGDNYYPPLSASMDQIVSPAPSKIHLTVIPKNPKQGATFEIKATVSEMPARGDVPTGTVTIIDFYGGETIGTVSLNSGVATVQYQTSASAMDAYATYNGSSVIAPSNSGLVLITFTQ